jgi:PleD family two-component response regulator
MNTVMMLEDMGHTVLEAGSGTKALAFLTERDIDLIVTDQGHAPNDGVPARQYRARALARIYDRSSHRILGTAAGGTHGPATSVEAFGERQLEDIIQKAMSGQFRLPRQSYDS